MHLRSVIVVATLAASVASCRGPSTSESALRRIVLTPGSSISISVDPDGNSEVAVTVPPGHPDAGTYVTHSAALLDDAHDASDSLDDPNATAAIQVDASGAIVVIENEVTKR